MLPIVGTAAFGFVSTMTFRLAVIAALGLFALSSAEAAAPESWLGPGKVCSPDTMLEDWGGMRTSMAKYGIGFGLQEQTEVWGNLAGGIKQGVAYNGLTTADLCIDLDKGMHWTGARIFSYGFQIWGPGPTRDHVGSLQLISSIEATPSVKLYDLWFEQDLLGGNVSFRFGQGGLDDEFMEADYDTLFINSSFTLPPLIALNLPAGGPAYPLAAPFARLRIKPINGLSLMSGIFTENPAPPGSGDPQQLDLHGTAFRLNDHALSITELAYSPAFLGLPGTYKLGAWYATGPFTDQRRAINGLLLANPVSGGIPLVHPGDYAVYAIANQMLWHRPKNKDQGIGVFLSIQHSPEDRNLNSWFIDGGFNWKAPFPRRPNDTAGIAFTYAGMGSALQQYGRDVLYYTGTGGPYAAAETIVEATYLIQLKSWLSLQPDLQYVINPGAGVPTPQAPMPLKNDLIIGMRFTLNF